MSRRPSSQDGRGIVPLRPPGGKPLLAREDESQTAQVLRARRPQLRPKSVAKVEGDTNHWAHLQFSERPALALDRRIKFDLVRFKNAQGEGDNGAACTKFLLLPAIPCGHPNLTAAPGDFFDTRLQLQSHSPGRKPRPHRLNQRAIAARQAELAITVNFF